MLVLSPGWEASVPARLLPLTRPRSADHLILQAFFTQELHRRGKSKRKGLPPTGCNPLYLLWCPERESNSHSCKNRGILSPLRLPIPPSGLCAVLRSKDYSLPADLSSILRQHSGCGLFQARKSILFSPGFISGQRRILIAA